ncbi:MAG: hypothetical protein MUE85_02060 [Microscillaceae bacterium]|jgi:predicted PurR-regulated permease PerM|nr:hypothetical protein [Microscillaceae bacterium]
MDNFSFDVIKILGYGASGLSFLLMFLAYNIIQKEQRVKKPRKEILNVVYVYMFFTLLNIGVVGFLGLPALSDNSRLQGVNEVLKTEKNKLTSLYEIQKNNSTIEDNIQNISSDSLETLFTKNVQALDTLSKTVESPEQKQTVLNIKDNLKKKIDSLTRLPSNNKRDLRKIMRDIRGYKQQLDKVAENDNK